MIDVETLLPYQAAGASWLSRTPQALLGDEMGLGKTGQAVSACDLVGARRIAVVCPAAARFNWRREFERFSPLDRPFQIRATGDPVGPGVVCFSFEHAADPHNLRALLDAGRFDVLIIDEAHFLKAKDAIRTRAIYKFLAPCAKSVWRLTGTPSPNGRPDELWPHLASAGLTTLTLEAFVSRYCITRLNAFDRNKPIIVGPKLAALPELRALIQKMTLRRTIAEVAPELPPVTHEVFHVEAAPVDEELWFTTEVMDPHAKAHFHASLKETNEQLRGLMDATKAGSSRGTTFDSRATILEGLANSLPMSRLRRYVGLAKVPPIVELLRGELKNDPTYKIVLFAYHRDVIVMLRDGLKEFGAVMFFGGMAAAKKQKHLEDFGTSAKHRVFIGQITAAGTALDGLQKQCHDVGMVESSWVPGENAQAIMRVRRRGVSGPVRARWFAVDGSVDATIAETQRKKAADQIKILD